jgi:hypothetical protein
LKVENYKAGKQIFRRKLRRRDVSRDCGTDGGTVYSAGAGMSPATAGRTAGRFILLAQGCPKCADVVSEMFNRCAQRHSKVSELVVQNGFVVVPSVPDVGSEPLSQSESATPEMFCTGVSRLSKMFVNIENHYARRHSKVSE